MIRFLAYGLGTGWMPKAPGTWGTLLGLPIVYFSGNSLPFVVALTIFSWLVIYFYEKKSLSHDDPKVVIDEIAGISWCLFALPLTMPIMLAGFLLFRVLDIAKPFPISWADEKVPGAFGTLLDDLMAGAIGCVLLHIVVYYGCL